MSTAVDILLVSQSVLVFLFAGYEYLTLTNFPSLPPTNELTDKPRVSIILPVRNQADSVAECVSSLTHLDYQNKELIVVDGHSTDGTRGIVQRFGDKVTMLEEEPLPQGWVGKNWACHMGYQKSTGGLFLFTDGDSVHAHDSLTRTVAYLQASDADMVTIAPGAVLQSFWEKVLQPPIFLLIMLFVGGKWVNDDKRRNALGNGQYMLIRRSSYEHVGGHEAVRDKIVEDYTLARLMKRSGLRLRIVTAQDAVGVRMYSSLGEIWRGWRKNFYTIAENHNFVRSILRLVLMFAFLVLPFVILAYGIWLTTTTALNIYLFTGAFMACLLWLGMVVLDRSIGISAAYAFLFPLAILVYIGIGIDSTIRGSLGLGFPWKGRVYGLPNDSQLKARMP